MRSRIVSGDLQLLLCFIAFKGLMTSVEAEVWLHAGNLFTLKPIWCPQQMQQLPGIEAEDWDDLRRFGCSLLKARVIIKP